MTITSTGGGNPIIRINSTAKNGTLGTQTVGAANQITLDTSLTAVNNGSITAPLVGRLLILRRGQADEETKKITSGADSATEIFVHENWTNPPQSGDTYDISYVFDDITAFTGMSLSAKTGIYEASRGIHVGTSGGGTFAYLALKDQEAFEIRDDSGNPSLVIEPNGRYDVGYKRDEQPIGGGIMHVLNDGNAEPSVQLASGSNIIMNDTVLVSFRENVSFFGQQSSLTGGYQEVNSIKMINFGNETDLSPSAVGSADWRNVNYSVNSTVGIFIGVSIDENTVIDTWTFVGSWFTTQDNFTSESLELRNVTWIAPENENIVVEQNKTWNVVNPAWTINTGSHQSIGWAIATGGGSSHSGQVLEKFSIDVTVVSASGDPISGSAVYIYEGLANQNLPTDNQMYTDVNGQDASDVQTRRFTSGSTTLIVTQSGDFALKAYRYGFNPFASAISFTRAQTPQVTLTIDTALSAANETDALANGGLGITPIKHGPGEIDPLPLLVLHYDGGAGTAPSEGQIVSGTTSTAQGSVLELRYGDNTDAFLVLSGWNGLQFTNNETIGNDSGWSALADTTGGASSFQEEFTWEYQMSGSSHQVVYDYDRARLAENPTGSLAIYQEAIIWGEDEQTSMIYSDGTNYSTERNVNLQEGVWLTNPLDPGLVEYMTSDSGSQFVPPQSYTFTFTGLQTLSEVRLYDTSTNPPTEIAGTENSSTTFSYNYVYSGADVNIYAVIFHLQYRDIRLTGLTLSNADQTIPIQQQTDRVYSNP